MTVGNMSAAHYGIVKAGTNIIFLVIAVGHLFSQMNIDKVIESWLISSLTVNTALLNQGEWRTSWNKKVFSIMLN